MTVMGWKEAPKKKGLVRSRKTQLASKGEGDDGIRGWAGRQTGKQARVKRRGRM